MRLANRVEKKNMKCNANDEDLATHEEGPQTGKITGGFSYFAVLCTLD